MFCRTITAGPHDVSAVVAEILQSTVKSLCSLASLILSSVAVTFPRSLQLQMTFLNFILNDVIEFMPLLLLGPRQDNTGTAALGSASCCHQQQSLSPQLVASFSTTLLVFFLGDVHEIMPLMLLGPRQHALAPLLLGQSHAVSAAVISPKASNPQQPLNIRGTTTLSTQEAHNPQTAPAPPPVPK